MSFVVFFCNFFDGLILTDCHSCVNDVSVHAACLVGHVHFLVGFLICGWYLVASTVQCVARLWKLQCVCVL